MVSHFFSENKDLMLNAIYDTLDRVGLSIIEANSERGTLLVSLGKDSELRINVIPASTSNADSEVVIIGPEDATAQGLLRNIITTLNGN